MSPRAVISLLVVCLCLASTEGRAFKNEKARLKRQAGSRCVGGVREDLIGEIEFGSGQYQNNEDCCFELRPYFGGSFTVDLEFSVFDIEQGPRCSYDSVTYGTSDGITEIDCGTKDVGYIRSFNSTDSFQLCFHSDGSQVGRGINVFYMTIPVPSLNYSTTPSLNVTASPSLNYSTAPSLNVTASPSLNYSTTPSLNVTASSSPNFTLPYNNATSSLNTTGNETQSCNRYLTGERGNFSSPNYNQTYPNRQDCATVISGLTGDYTLRVNFTRFDLESNSACRYDWLQFSWANNQTEKACGHEWDNRTLEFDVDGGNVTASFHSDGSVTKPGFFATYEIKPRGVPRSRRNCTFTTRAEHGMIQSLPGTGEDYENNLNCSYVFNVPSNSSLHFNFTTFDLEGGNGCPFDYVQINGGRRWCGSTINGRQVNGTGEVVLRFVTDGSVRRRGFVARFNIRMDNGTSPNTTVAPANTTIVPANTTVVPPNTTVAPANTTIVPANTTVVPPNTTVVPPNTTVVPANTTIVPANTTGNGSQSCNRYLTGERGNFSSPNYNQTYPNRQDCATVISGLTGDYTLRVNFTRFDLESNGACRYDWLQFSWANNQTEKACGHEWDNRTLEFDVDGGNFTALFHSDGSVTRPGFFATYEIKPRGVPRNRHNCTFTARAEHGMIQSLPGTEEDYENNLNCSYVFSVPSNSSLHFNFTTFDLEGGNGCPYDYVQINGGRRWCGSTITERRVNGTGEVVLRFVTDGSVKRRGFVARYNIRMVAPANTTVAPGNTTVAPGNITVAPSNTTVAPGNTTVAPGNTTVAPGNITVAPGNITVAPGNITIAPGNTTVAPGNYTVAPGNTTVQPYDVTTYTCNYDTESLEGRIALATDIDGFYANNEECRINLYSPALPHVTTINFTRFDVEYNSNCRYDSLSVRLGNNTMDTLCGNNRGPFVKQYSNAEPLLAMTFVSDSSVSGLGFAFDYQTEVEYCNAVINGTSGSFATPPGGYSPNMECTYTINTPTPAELHFTFEEFDIESASRCTYDAVTMGEDRLCGSSPGSKTYQSDGTFVITFTSDGSVQREGFYMSFTSLPVA
ncbi:cubilin-like [Haliotis rufescens]|uniref:cubilin-like n=1 Tax=Haliotis rufescens TaxID=6454 RepID=UPI00201E9C30|nr:cubilin-like [Haliotis rufescens]